MAGGHVKLDVRKLQQLRKDLAPRAQQLITKAARDTEGGAKDFVVQKHIIDTGALHNSIEAKQQKPLLWWVIVGVEYAIYQELGTRRMRARPYLVPALEQVKPKFLAAWKQLFSGYSK